MTLEQSVMLCFLAVYAIDRCFLALRAARDRKDAKDSVQSIGALWEQDRERHEADWKRSQAELLLVRSQLQEAERTLTIQRIAGRKPMPKAPPVAPVNRMVQQTSDGKVTPTAHHFSNEEGTGFVS